MQEIKSTEKEEPHEVWGRPVWETGQGRVRREIRRRRWGQACAHGNGLILTTFLLDEEDWTMQSCIWRAPSSKLWRWSFGDGVKKLEMSTPPGAHAVQCNAARPGVRIGEEGGRGDVLCIQEATWKRRACAWMDQRVLSAYLGKRV